MAEDQINKPSKFVKDLSGKRFGRLLVLSFTDIIDGHSRWFCECDCGVKIVSFSEHLSRGATKSCGCYRKQRVTKHGLHGTREYSAWQHAKNRCFRLKDPEYPVYGGRGITMCDEWKNDFAAFFRDMGPCPENLELDRIDTNGNYEKGNCRWTDRLTQSRNKQNSVRITRDGQTLSAKEWSELSGIPHSTIYRRYLAGRPLFATLRRGGNYKRPHTE